MGQWQSTAAVNDVVLTQGYALVTNGEEGLSIVDITEPANPSQRTSLSSRGLATRLYMSRNYALVTESRISLVIVDISDRPTPQETGFAVIKSPAHHPHLPGGAWTEDCGGQNSEATRRVD